MNRNLLKYSFRFMAVLFATVMFAACEKDQFQEKDALSLELKKLWQERMADSLRRAQDANLSAKLLGLQRKIDSLTAVDAAGKVFYSVIPVSGTNAIFTSGGRVEDVQGEDGCTVTINQWGTSTEATGSKNGVYSFPALYSGEVGVTVKKNGWSTANYVANLTPDGPVGNGKFVYVSNIIPLFEISTDEAKMAKVMGKAWIETNLTNNTEETAPVGTAFTANIDVTRTSDNNGGQYDGTAFNSNIQGYTGGIKAMGRSVFKARYLDEWNDEGLNVGGNSTSEKLTNGSQSGITGVTKSGWIQRIAYELATLPRSTVNASGDYSMLVPSTSIGLPIKMEFSELAADRTFFRGNSVVTTRHLYGPNVKADNVDRGVDPPAVTFQAFQTEATVTASYTAEVTSTSLAARNDAGYHSTTFARRGGSYLGLPTTAVTTANGGTGGTISTAFSADEAIAGTGLKFISVRQTATSGTSGYTADPTVTLTRTDYFLFGQGKQESVQAGGIADYIKIENGGYNFIPVSSTSVTSGFTNTLPLVQFFDPATRQNFTVNIPTVATATVIIDQTVGAVSHIPVGSRGSGYPTTPAVVFNYGSAYSITRESKAEQGNPTQIQFTSAAGAAINKPANIFVSNGNNGIQFNPLYPTSALGAAAGTGANITNSVLSFMNTTNTAGDGGAGSNYTFVPSATAVYTQASSTPNPVTSAATFSVEVVSDITKNNLGKIKSITINNPGNYGTGTIGGFDFVSARIARASGFTTVDNTGAAYTGFGAADASAAIQLSVTPDNSNKLSATAFPYGTGINNYTINPGTENGQNAGTKINTLTSLPGAMDSKTSLTFITTNANLVPVYAFTSAGVNLGNNTAYALSSSASDARVWELIKVQPYLVAFEAPASSPFTYAWGFPTYDASGGVLGVRIINAGAGYSATNQTIDMYIIPNPFKGTTAAAGTGWPSNNDIASLITHFGTPSIPSTAGAGAPSTTAATSTVLMSRTRTAATLTFTVTNGGKGYYAAPEFVVIADGMPLERQYQIGGIAAGGAANTGGTITMEDGTIKSISTLTFALGNDPLFMTGKTISVKVIDRMSALINERFTNSTTTAGIDGKMGAGGKIGTSRDGAITSISMDKWTNMPGVADFKQVVDLNSAGNGNSWRTGFFNYPPTVTISKPLIAGGTQATATSELYLVNGDRQGDGGANATVVTVPTGGTNYDNFGKIFRIGVTNGGSGYQSGNWMHGSKDQGNEYTSAAQAAQGFRIIGGNENVANGNATNGQGGKGDGTMNNGNTNYGTGAGSSKPFDMENTQGEDNVHFDVFTGITYVRDVHYGTGKEVE